MTCVTSLSYAKRRLLLAFVIHAFQSLDVPLVRKECAPLVSVSIWAGLSTEEKRDVEFEKFPATRKSWKASLKRFDSAGNYS